MPVIEIDNFRKKYPDYNDIDDMTLASKLAEKYPDSYGDLPQKVGMSKSLVMLKPKEKIGTNVYSPDFLKPIKENFDNDLYKKTKNALSIAATHDINPDLAMDITEEYIKQVNEPNLYEKAVGSFKAGWGDVYSSIGGILKRKNIGGDLGDTYIEFGEKLKHAYIPPSDQSEFTWRKMLDPEWYATTATRSVPFALSLAPAAVIGAYGGAAVAGAVGLGAFGTTVLGAIGGASLSRPVESAFEGQGAYDEAIEKGMSMDEAEKAANQVFWDNMKLVGLDALQFTAAFLPMGNVAGNTVKSTLNRRILAATGKLAGVGLMEGGEERYQEKAVMDAVGDPVSFFDFSNPRLNEASAAGAVFGVGLGGAGSVFTALKDRVVKTMPEPVKQVYEQAKENGMSDIEALDAVAETPEGKQHIEDVVTELKDLVEGKEPKKTVQQIISETQTDESDLETRFNRLIESEDEITDETLSQLLSDEVLGEDMANLSGVEGKAQGTVNEATETEETKKSSEVFNKILNFIDIGQSGKVTLKGGEQNLAIVHNLTAANLRHAIKQGGLAVPSTAIIDVNKSQFDSFGEITLIADKSKLGPGASTANKYFNADVYSPRYPTVQYFLTDRSEKTLYTWLNPIWKSIPRAKDQDYIGSNYVLNEDIKKDGIEATFEHEQPILYYAYLSEMGRLPEGVDTSWESKNKLRDTVEEIGIDKYKQWAKEKIKELNLEADEKIFNGYTYQGNRRYLKHDLDTVVRLLKKELQDGEGFNYGVPSIRAKTAKRYRTIKQIQEDRDKIVSSEDMEKLKEETNNRFSELASQAVPFLKYGKDEFGAYERFLEHIKEAIDTHNFRKVFGENSEYYNPGVDVNSIIEFVNELRYMPTEYFEGKIQRAVGLTEFERAVVPDDTPADLVDWLNSRGIRVDTYKKNDAVDRAVRVASAAKEGGTSGTLLFSGVDPTQIIPILKSIGQDIKAAMPYLETLGLKAYEAGKNVFTSWSETMKSYLGDIWETFKDVMTQVWEQVKAINERLGERGSFSTKPISLYEAVKKAGGIDPEYIKEYYNWKEDIQQYGLVNLTKKGGRALDDLATELQSQGILDLTPDEYAGPGDYLLSELKRESETVKKKGTEFQGLTAEEKAAIKELEDQWRSEGATEDEIKEVRIAAQEIFDDKAAKKRGAKTTSQSDLLQKRIAQLRSVIPTDKVKTIIRRNTGQTNLSKLVYEDEALNAAFKKAAQAARIAFREGNREGIEKQKAIMKEALKQAQQRAAEKAQKEKDIKTIQKLAEMKGDIAVDYQKKIKELMTGFDFKNITAQKWKELQGLKDYIDREGVPLGIKPKRIAELSRLTDINVKDLTPEQIGGLKEQLKTLTQLGKLKANLKYKYKAREHARILNEIKETTNNLDPVVKQGEDRFRDRLKVAGINFYLDTLHTPRVADMADQFKDYKGVQAKLIRSTGEAETEAVSTSMQRGLAFLDFLQKEGIEVIPEESESDIRMNIVMRYREGARTQAETLMKHYNITELPTLTEQEEKIIGYIQKDMEANKGKLAAAWEEVENEIFPEQEVYYLPLKYAKEEEIIPDVQTEGRGRTTHTFDGFSHARRPGVKKLPRVGVLQLYQEAVLEQEWYTQIQPVIADIKSVVLTEEYKESAGEVLYNWWKDQLDILSRRGWSASAQLNALSSFMRLVRHNVNKAVLGFKLSTIIMQPFAVFDGMAYVNALIGTRAAGKVLTETTKSFLIPGTTKEIVEKSDALQQREGGELAITEEMKRAKGETVKDKMIRAAFNLISKADVKTAAGVQEAVRKVFIDEGMSPDEAQKEAEFVMHMSQGSSSIAYRPHILAKGEGARTWFTFQTFIMNRWGILAHDLIIGKITKDTFTKKLAGLVSIGLLVMAGAAEDEAREWLYNLTHKKDLREDKRSVPEKVFVNLSSTMPFFGNFIEAASRNRDAYPPAMKTVMTGFQGGRQMFTGKDSTSQFKGALKAAETGLTLGLGYPGTAQFFDLLEGALIKEKPKRR